MMFQLFDVVTFRSGERCKVSGRTFTDKGLALWAIRCLSRHWAGVIHLTTHELERNVV